MSLPLPRAAAGRLALLSFCTALATAADSGIALGNTGATARLIDLSVDVMAVGGASTASDAAIPGIYGGHHDPARRGFTLQQAEFAFAGAVDPFLRADISVVAGEEGFELEEAYATSTSLPASLQARAGYYLTEFGRTNASHPHRWPWLTKPVVATRLLGPDGLRGAGARIAWLTPLPWYSRLIGGAQNAADETAISFRGEGHAHDGEDPTAPGGRPLAEELGVRSVGDLLWSARWENAVTLGATTVRLGVSWSGGPNASGEDARTDLYGADLVARWSGRGGRQGWPFVQLEVEAMARRYEAAAFDDGTDAYPRATLTDRGGHAALLWGFTPGWAAGLRGEWAGGSGESDVDGFARDEDHARADRVRVSPLLTWNPTHFSRLRLQYDLDRFDAEIDEGDDTAHSVWLGLEVLIGSHLVHGF